MNPMFKRTTGAQAPDDPLATAGHVARGSRGLLAALLGVCLVPLLAACEPRFGEGNTTPRTPPTQPVPGSAPAPGQ